MGICLKKYLRLLLGSGRRLISHLVASRLVLIVSVNDGDGDTVQLVVTGDFFQLPPITKTSVQPFFAFECDAWKACIEHTVTLTQVFRQRDDSTYSRPILG